MSLWRKLFGRKDISPNNPAMAIAARLASNDDSTFLSAMNEAIGYTPKGIDIGLRAMEEAMRCRAGNHSIGFTDPKLGALRVRDSATAAQAPEMLVELAKSRALLREPRISQDVMSACLSYHGFGAVRECALSGN